MGQKHDQGPTCLPQTAAGLVLRSLDLDVAPRTADRLSHQTRTYKQTSTNNKKQYIKKYKQYKKRLLNYCTRCKDHVGRKNHQKWIKNEKVIANTWFKD